MSRTEHRTTYREVFAEPVFRVLFGSRTLATAAGTLRIVALSLLVFASTGSPLLSAIAFGVGFLPQAVGGTLLGSLADRIAPRTLIAAGYALECAAAAVLGLVALPVAASLVLVAAVATLAPIFNGASSRLVAEALQGDAYVLGRSLSTVASAGAQLLGLAAGGIAVGALGPRHALLLSAAAELFAALWVRLLLAPLERMPPVAGSAVRQSWTSTVDFMRAPAVRGLLLVQWLPPAFSVGAEALVIPYFGGRGFSTGQTGLLLAAVPLGMLVGSVIVGRLVRPAGRERLVVPLLAGSGVAIAGLAAPVPFAVAAILLALLGAGFSYSIGLQRRFLDAVAVDRRGQAFALQSTGLMTLQGLGPVVIGAIGQFGTLPAALAVAGGASVLIALAWWRYDIAVTPRDLGSAVAGP